MEHPKLVYLGYPYLRKASHSIDYKFWFGLIGGKLVYFTCLTREFIWRYNMISRTSGWIKQLTTSPSWGTWVFEGFETGEHEVPLWHCGLRFYEDKAIWSGSKPNWTSKNMDDFCLLHICRSSASPMNGSPAPPGMGRNSSEILITTCHDHRPSPQWIGICNILAIGTQDIYIYIYILISCNKH